MSTRTQKETVPGKASVSFTGDDNTGLHSPSSDRVSQMAGGVTVTSYGMNERGVYSCALPIAGTSGSTGVFASLANPAGADLLITRATLDVTTQSAGAATVDIGTAANATTSNDGLIDGKSVAAAGTFDNLVAADAGTNGKVFRKWPAAHFVNVAEASGDVNGLVATLYVQYVRL